MSNFLFASLRLGKTSIEDINTINMLSAGLVEPVEIHVTCTQIPQELDNGVYTLIWLGSDNSKGAPTAWKQGYKAFGVVTNVVRGESYNSDSTTTVKVLYVFKDSVNRLDLLQYAPKAYFWCSSFPVIGLDDHSNQTIRMFDENGERSSLNAMFSALNIIDKTLRPSLCQLDPAFDDYFYFSIKGDGEDSAEHNFRNLQKIYYGTPGSGKSYKVSKEVGDTPYRTIFHPDSDYASFVGSYKPVGEGEEIGYSFVEQIFTTAYIDAWKHPELHINLVIEEINRGNCAQIFGDLFQLLDRKNGYSEYPVTPNKDLQNYLKKSFADKDNPFVSHGYNPRIEELVSSGSKMVLPSNMSIIATMNTSDQSLFPMDSAFKRRWEWEYVPICYDSVTEDGEANDAFNFTIDLDNGESYRWIDFLKGVNVKIKKSTDSEDKQMGNFFIKSSVNAPTFINKVMYYLWSEVCKDEYHTTNNFFRYDNAAGEELEFSFNELYPIKDKALEKLSSFIKKMIAVGQQN